jgi:hypothetical protein
MRQFIFSILLILSLTLPFLSGIIFSELGTNQNMGGSYAWRS